jgi:hypothetical protein
MSYLGSIGPKDCFTPGHLWRINHTPRLHCPVGMQIKWLRRYIDLHAYRAIFRDNSHSLHGDSTFVETHTIGYIEVFTLHQTHTFDAEGLTVTRGVKHGSTLVSA